MSDDIFHSWKNSRFVLVDYHLFDEPELMIVLTDFQYWSDVHDELMEWCRVNGGEVKGMTVSFKTQEQLTMFSLRWI